MEGMMKVIIVALGITVFILAILAVPYVRTQDTTTITVTTKESTTVDATEFTCPHCNTTYDIIIKEG